ncbi:MAG: menaquinone biosynthesis protein [Verrucomicrobia bacterium]|nr:menaquinone biosynthesis protein [Verrucomicrobiota bacterium]
MSAPSRTDTHPLSRFRVGSVPYLNAVPLTAGIEDHVVFAPPSQLAGMLENETLDAALVSITEALLHPGYLILDDVAVASDGPVQSVFLATKCPLENVHTVHCDPASLTSINLLKILLSEKGITPRWQPLTDYETAVEKEAVLLIGDPAISFRMNHAPHQIWDLGQAWQECFQLPFVYAVWAIRESSAHPDMLKGLYAAKQNGMQHLDAFVRNDERFDAAFRSDYLGKAIRYDLGSREKTGIDRFTQKLATVLHQTVYPPRYVSPSKD